MVVSASYVLKQECVSSTHHSNGTFEIWPSVMRPHLRVAMLDLKMSVIPLVGIKSLFFCPYNIFLLLQCFFELHMTDMLTELRLYTDWIFQVPLHTVTTLNPMLWSGHTAPYIPMISSYALSFSGCLLVCTFHFTLFTVWYCCVPTIWQALKKLKIN